MMRGSMMRLRSADERFGRDATDIHAGATDGQAVVDDRDAPAALCGAGGGSESSGTTADNDEVAGLRTGVHGR